MERKSEREEKNLLHTIAASTVMCSAQFNIILPLSWMSREHAVSAFIESPKELQLMALLPSVCVVTTKAAYCRTQNFSFAFSIFVMQNNICSVSLARAPAHSSGTVGWLAGWLLWSSCERQQ